MENFTFNVLGANAYSAQLWQPLYCSTVLITSVKGSALTLSIIITVPQAFELTVMQYWYCGSITDTVLQNELSQIPANQMTVICHK